MLAFQRTDGKEHIQFFFLQKNPKTLITKVLGSFAALPGFEPGNDGIRIRCLTTWRQRYVFVSLASSDSYIVPDFKTFVNN